MKITITDNKESSLKTIAKLLDDNKKLLKKIEKSTNIIDKNTKTIKTIGDYNNNTNINKAIKTIKTILEDNETKIGKNLNDIEKIKLNCKIIEELNLKNPLNINLKPISDDIIKNVNNISDLMTTLNEQNDKLENDLEKLKTII